MLSVIFLLLIAAPKSNAQSLEKISLVTAKETANICSSPLKPYVLTRSYDCPISEERQVQFLANVKSPKTEEFSVSHSVSMATYLPTPTPIKSVPTPTVIVSEINIATSSPIQSEPSPTVIVAEQSISDGGNNPAVVLELVNAHRASLGKPAFITNGELCSLAQTRSTELASEMQRGVLHSGLYNRNLGYWITENAKTGGDENETLRWWLNSSIHRSQIQSDYVNACVGCTGKNCALLFTSYTPKGKSIVTATGESLATN